MIIVMIRVRLSQVPETKKKKKKKNKGHKKGGPPFGQPLMCVKQWE